MKIMRKMIAATALFSLALLAPGIVQAQSPHDAIQQFFKDYFEESLKDNPEFATGVGHHEYNDRWTDWSKSGRGARLAHAKQRLRDLAQFDAAKLSGEDQLSARLLQYDLKQQVESDELSHYILRLNQLYGLHNRVYLTVDRMPARTVKDYENIISRLHGVPVYVDQNIAILDEAIAKGLTQPKVVVDLILKQIEGQVAQDQSNTALLAAFWKFPDSFSAGQKEKLKNDATAAYEEEFLPAWKKLLNYIQTTYAAHARPGTGIGSLPNGKAYYAILVRRSTTTNLTPEEIHFIGEKELARLEAEMQAITRETGFTGTLEEFQKKLDAMPEQHFRSKDEMLMYCRNAAKLIEPELPNLFQGIPRMLYGIRPIPEEREQATASNAQAPTPDGATPGWFNLNTYQPEKQVRYDKDALTLHEAVPGHIFQGTIARSLSGIPEFRKFYGNSAYAEGWALYAESLGSQLGVYRDPYSRFGRLSSERFRAVRLVVDTGLHVMGWSREQALDFFKAHAPEESSAEIDRYISWPGQALAYKLGQLKILELRKQAQEKRGAKFEIREFHDAILREGGLPLELLQEHVQKYINAN